EGAEGAFVSVTDALASVLGVRAARTVGWKRESIHTPPAPTAAEASRPAVAAAVRPVYSPKKAAPMITATIGSMTVSPASTVSAGPRAYAVLTRQNPETEGSPTPPSDVHHRTPRGTIPGSPDTMTERASTWVAAATVPKTMPVMTTRGMWAAEPMENAPAKRL